MSEKIQLIDYSLRYSIDFRETGRKEARKSVEAINYNFKPKN